MIRAAGTAVAGLDMLAVPEWPAALLVVMRLMQLLCSWKLWWLWDKCHALPKQSCFHKSSQVKALHRQRPN